MDGSIIGYGIGFLTIWIATLVFFFCLFISPLACWIMLCKIKRQQLELADLFVEEMDKQTKLLEEAVKILTLSFPDEEGLEAE